MRFFFVPGNLEYIIFKRPLNFMLCNSCLQMLELVLRAKRTVIKKKTLHYQSHNEDMKTSLQSTLFLS